jgi:hypothetical protein
MTEPGIRCLLPDGELEDPSGPPLDCHGVPEVPIRYLPIDEWCVASDGIIASAAGAVTTSLSLTVGVATKPPSPSLRPLLDALSLTLVPPGAETANRQLIGVADPWQALDQLVAAVGRCPRASVALGQLLYQTCALDTMPGLAAEAAVYSVLLGGTEYRDWLADRGKLPPAPVPDRPFVILQRTGGSLSIMLNHPERRNALSIAMREALLEALELAIIDDTIERIVLSGAGPVFCSGGDLAEFGLATDLVAAYLVRLHRAPWRLIDRLRDRVTVWVHGAAVGAGLEMAAFADRLVAAPGSYFLLPEMQMGLVPGAGGTVSVTRRIGRWRAAWMMLSGNRVDAETALQWGLVDEIGSHE